MKYLSFDIECCDGQHICEFGYVLIDEQFNVLERDCITINPEYKFKLTGRERESDISLAFPEEVYYNSPTFDFYYERIKSIFTMSDCQIIGFSLSNDVKYAQVGKYIASNAPNLCRSILNGASAVKVFFSAVEDLCKPSVTSQVPRLQEIEAEIEEERVKHERKNRNYKY